ncbi:unnamed protein product [Clonostachys solani]|uniref:CHAT domain-containing protein n=1 Tax=Clonostachys solani TaxID=160281 RepID=A0A9N9ZEU4_9HYPO|nr:unnamed protein product [Clonostachys solani]
MDNLDVAVQQSQDALDLMPPGDPDRAFQLHHLGYLYQERYNNYRTPTNLEDLDRAIQHYHSSLDLTPKAHPLRAARLHDLGTSYNDKYHRTKALNFLDDAIQQFQGALDLTPKNNPDRVARLQSLASSYDDKYERTKALEDLEGAILQFEAALDLTPDDDQVRVTLLQDLAPAYHAKYWRTGNIEDLSKTIRYLKEDLDLSSDDMFRFDMHMTLGKRYYDRYLKTKSWADLEMMIQECEDALDWTPDNAASRQQQDYFLGAGYYHKYQRNKDMEDLNLSTQYCEAAFDSPVALSPYYWIRSGNLLVSILAETKQSSSASNVASAAISHIHQLAPRGSSIPDKQLVLGEISQLASDAAALALIAGDKPTKALQTLELGHNVITTALSDMRTDISKLLQEHRELGEEYIKLRDQLNTLRLNDESYNPDITVRNRDWRLKLRGPGNMERLIQKIQALPGFEGFLLGPTENELKSAAKLGPVVIINVSDYRCDALIITKDKIRSLALPGLDVDDIRFRAETLTSPDSNLLEWLWDTITKPVLDSLGFVQIPRDRWPHVWWIPTGLLAKFPIHAAGYHDSSSTVLDRAISSYSSSVRTLLRSRQKDPSAETKWEPNKIVAVGLTETPGQSDLPFVKEEIKGLKRIWGQISSPEPRREDILAALRDCEVFHFAGHALADRSDPLQSSLILHAEHLSVASVLEVNLQSRAPFLAYLSACGTGQIKQNELVNERLHLIAAYQLAGFRHVIGTLWEVNDESCVGIATETYEWVKSRNMSDESVSEGLHHASRKSRTQWVLENAVRTDTNRLQPGHTQSDLPEKTVRDTRDAELFEGKPALWIPYVHFGS